MRYLIVFAECELRFAAFNDGWTQYGFVVFGIESVDFPSRDVYNQQP